MSDQQIVDVLAPIPLGTAGLRGGTCAPEPGDRVVIPAGVAGVHDALALLAARALHPLGMAGNRRIRNPFYERVLRRDALG